MHPEDPRTSVGVHGIGAPPRWHYALLLFLPVICYANSFRVPFALDDDASIVVNPDLGNWSAERFSPPSRRLAYLTFKLNYLAGGLEPTGYHAVNVAIHVLAGFVVYALARRLLRLAGATDQPTGWLSRAALCGALVFLLHPIQTQAVTYIVQRLASLATLLYATAILLYVVARTTPTNRTRFVAIAGAAAAAFGALFTKEISFTLPLAIALVEFSFFPSSPRRRAVLLAPLLALLVVIPLTWASRGLSVGSTTIAGSSATRLEYAATQTRVVIEYLRLLVWPVGQNLDHDIPMSLGFGSAGVLARLALLITLSAAAVMLLVKSRTPGLRLVGAGTLLFFLGLSIESSFVPIADVMFEHRVYLPMVGGALALSGALHAAVTRAPESSNRIFAAMTAGIVALGGATIARNHVWRSPVTLWGDVVEKSPRKARGHYNLGNALRDAGDLSGARRQWLEAVALNPRHSYACNQLGSLAMVAGDVAAAEGWFRRAIEGLPVNPEARYNLALVLEATGRSQEASEHFRRFVETAPPFLSAAVDRVCLRFGWRRP